MQNQSLSYGLETVFEAKPEGGWPVIYADPPWSFKTYSEKGEGRSPKNHYPVMPLADICAMPIGDLAAKDAHLFLWSTAPHFVESLKVVAAWGFTYSTIGFTWIKTSSKAPATIFNPKCLHWGMGRTTRANAEYVIYARRGKPARTNNKGVHSVIVSHGDLDEWPEDWEGSVILAPVREHSRKPEEARERIQLLCDGPYLELFARQQSEGWTAWGNQSDKFGSEV
jgi:N6-adenosine-specific RNA methylase IME4